MHTTIDGDWRCTDDRVIGWHEYIEAFRETLPDDIHPCAQQFICEMISAMWLSAEEGDAAGVVLCIHRIQHRIEQERRFEAENERTIASLNA